MRIDLPRCKLKSCHYCLDGNCTEVSKYENCLLTDLNYKIAELTVDLENAKQEVVKDTVEAIQAHLNMLFKALQNEKTEATVEKLIEINSKIAILESVQLALGDLQKKYIGE